MNAASGLIGGTTLGATLAAMKRPVGGRLLHVRYDEDIDAALVAIVDVTRAVAQQVVDCDKYGAIVDRLYPRIDHLAQEMMIARLRGKPKLLREVKPDLPARLEQVLNKAMSLDAGDRFPTMAAFAEAIEGAEESGVFARLFRK